MAIIQKEYTVFQDWINSKLANNRTPFSGTFELTPACNFSCPHCYIQSHRDENPALNTEQVKAILDQLRDANCLAISFTGGEPLLRQDYREIHEYAYRQGFWISLFTNGSLINESMVNFLEEFPPRVVEISLYGGDEETYCEISGIPDQFAKVKEAVDLLIERKIDVTLKSVLLKPLLKSMDKMQQFAKERDLKIVFDPSVTPTIDSDTSPVSLRVPAKQAVELEFSIPGSIDKLAIYHEKILSLGSREGQPQCGAGFSGFHIGYNGELMACVMLREPAYSLTEMTFSEAWKRLGKSTRPIFDLDSECSTCELNHLCSFCPGSLYCNETYPKQKKSYYCVVASNRMVMLKKNSVKAKIQ